MKIRIKSEFWEEDRVEVWKYRYDKYNFFMGFIALSNIFGWFIVGYNGMGIWNSLVLGLITVIIISNKKRK